ncbi:hypothetical protein GCM10027321_45050 [Massilia terrae]|uniref:Uncharacterized protein n=1 Tax=Massilia terrae TaxID=1811224 RepID=A0ABT2CSD7_9BURK|nr:hypothetical protein [Massilia terrae]MCS0656881.1 hypothetical protein [Massilia terrae]
MIGKYKQVAIDDAGAGMVLADEVCDHQGKVLLAKGATLSDTLLVALRRRGVESVRIEDGGISAEELEAERERVAARLAQLFRKPHGGAADALLRAQVEAYRAGQLQ